MHKFKSKAREGEKVTDILIFLTDLLRLLYHKLFCINVSTKSLVE